MTVELSKGDLPKIITGVIFFITTSFGGGVAYQTYAVSSPRVAILSDVESYAIKTHLQEIDRMATKDDIARINTKLGFVVDFILKNNTGNKKVEELKLKYNIEGNK